MTDEEKATFLESMGISATASPIIAPVAPTPPTPPPASVPVPPPVDNSVAIAKLQAELKDRVLYEPDLIGRARDTWMRRNTQIRADISALGGVPAYANGTTSIAQNQLAMLHAGEAIIPKTFAEGIRSGEMVLSGSGTSGDSGGITVVVNVQGSVTSENDLVKSIASNLYNQRRRGLVTV